MRTLMIVATALALAGCATGSPPTYRVETHAGYLSSVDATN